MADELSGLTRVLLGQLLSIIPRRLPVTASRRPADPVPPEFVIECNVFDFYTTGEPVTERDPQPASGLSEEATLLLQFLRWAQIVGVALGTVLGVLYAIFRSPMSLALALLAFLVCLPGLRYAQSRVHRNRTQAAVFFIASLLWTISLALSLIGFRVFAASAMVAVLSVVIALPYSTPKLMRRVMVGAALVCALDALLALFGPVVVSTLPAETSQMVVLTFVPILLGLCLISLWHSSSRLRRSGDEMKKAILRLGESERTLERRVEQRTAELDQKIAEIMDINEVARTVNSTLDLQRVMQAVMKSLQKLFSFDQMVLGLLDESRDRLLVKQPMGAGFTEDLLARLRGVAIPMTEEASAFVHTVQHQRPVLLPSITPEMVQLMSPSDRVFYEMNPPKGLFICPLEIQDEVIGLMFFGNTPAPLELSEEQIETIKRYVTHVATAVKNARLFDEVAQRTEELDQKVAEISDINEVARTVNSTLDLRRVMQAVMTSLQKLFSFDQMVLGLLNEPRDGLLVKHPLGAGFTEEMVERLRGVVIPMAEEASAFVHTVQHQRPVLLPSITPEMAQLMSPSDRVFYDMNPIKGGLFICPLEIQDEVIGFMYFANTQARLELSEEQIETIKRYVTHVSIALKNARLFDEVAQRTEELDQKVAEISDINEVARTVNSTLDPRQVMEMAMNSLKKVHHFDAMALGLVDEEGRKLGVRLPMGEGFSEESLAALRDEEIQVSMDEDASAFVAAVKRHREVYLPEIGPEIVSMMSPSDRKIYRILPLKGLIICPLEIQDRAIGCVVIGNSKGSLDLSESEIETIKRYFTPVATAVENARLFNEVAQRTEELDRKVAEISDINEVARIVNSTLDLNRVMQTVMGSLQKVFDYDVMALGLLDDKGRNLNVSQPMGEGFSKEQLAALQDEEIRIPMDEEASAFAASVLGRKTLYFPEITREMIQLMSPSDRGIYGVSPLKGLIICPLEISDRAIGCMIIGNTKEAFYLSEGEI